MEKHPEMISLLIEAGVDYSLRDKIIDKHTNKEIRIKALHYALIREEEEAYEWTKEIFKV